MFLWPHVAAFLLKLVVSNISEQISLTVPPLLMGYHREAAESVSPAGARNVYCDTGFQYGDGTGPSAGGLTCRAL